MTIGSLAFGLDFSQSITLSTNYAKGSGTGGNGYSGIAFQLTYGTDRYVNSDLLTKNATYELTGITVQWRNEGGATKVGNGVQLVVTKSDMVVVGISNSTNELVKGVLPGKEGDQNINLAVNPFDKPVALDLDTPYYVFYVSDENVQGISIGNTLTEDSVASVNLMAQGSNSPVYEGVAQDFTMTKGIALTSQTYAPIGYLTVTKTSNVPEPTTDTLSLLALADLCIRRRAFESPMDEKRRKARSASKRNKVRWHYTSKEEIAAAAVTPAQPEA